MNEIFVNTNWIRSHRSDVGGSCLSRHFKNSSQAVIPSSCGILVYSEETSRVNRRQPGGSPGNLRNLLMKSVVSRIYDGSWETLGRRKKLAKREMFSAGAPFEARNITQAWKWSGLKIN